MAKKTDALTPEQKELKDLLLKRVIEKTDRYDKRIQTLQCQIDEFNYGSVKSLQK